MVKICFIIFFSNNALESPVILCWHHDNKMCNKILSYTLWREPNISSKNIAVQAYHGYVEVGSIIGYPIVLFMACQSRSEGGKAVYKSHPTSFINIWKTIIQQTNILIVFWVYFMKYTCLFLITQKRTDRTGVTR